jgi:hypothetical protein
MGTQIERAAKQADPGRIADQLDALHRFVSESADAIANSRAPISPSSPDQPPERRSAL